MSSGDNNATENTSGNGLSESEHVDDGEDDDGKTGIVMSVLTILFSIPALLGS